MRAEIAYDVAGRLLDNPRRLEVRMPMLIAVTLRAIPASVDYRKELRMTFKVLAGWKQLIEVVAVVDAVG